MSALTGDSDSEYVWVTVSEGPTLYFYELMDREPQQPIRYLLPDRAMFELARSKEKFQVFCEANGLPVPVSFSADNLAELRQEFRPVIAKKRIGAGSVGMKYVEKPEQLALLDDIDKDDYLIQEQIVSARKIHGIFCVAKDGEIISWHGHERLRTFPENDGVTVFSRSQYDPRCKDIAGRLLRYMNWSGFAMVELLQDDRNGEWKIIELNPRLWGSLMLSEFCGSNLLPNYVRVLSDEKAEPGEELTERYIRWVFPFEVISLLKGNISFGDFLNRRRLKTCYINFTYSSALRAVLFQVYFIFNSRSIARFFKKLLP
ncbi:MAG: ATP-grasp domain-containing protein [Desulfofustis sp.]|nr:ATP-grasp domain-containing protein [Desulfofustis sp.]